MSSVGTWEKVGRLQISLCPWESSEIHFPSLLIFLSHVICVSSISFFNIILLFLFYFIILSPTPLAWCSSWLQTNACLEFFTPLFHCQPLADISAGQMMTQSSLHPFCSLVINSLQNVSFIYNANINAVCCLLCSDTSFSYISCGAPPRKCFP